MDPESWIPDVDFGREGLHLNRNGARELGDLYSRVCRIDGGSLKALNDYTRGAASSVGRHQKGPDRRQTKNILRWVWKRWRHKKMQKKR